MKTCCFTEFIKHHPDVSFWFCSFFTFLIFSLFLGAGDCQTTWRSSYKSTTQVTRTGWSHSFRYNMSACWRHDKFLKWISWKINKIVNVKTFLDAIASLEMGMSFTWWFDGKVVSLSGILFKILCEEYFLEEESPSILLCDNSIEGIRPLC